MSEHDCLSCRRGRKTSSSSPFGLEFDVAIIRKLSCYQTHTRTRKVSNKRAKGNKANVAGKNTTKQNCPVEVHRRCPSDQVMLYTQHEYCNM
jgi:hypothetical protein